MTITPAHFIITTLVAAVPTNPDNQWELLYKYLINVIILLLVKLECRVELAIKLECQKLNC